MATIDTNVPIELDVESMRAGDPDLDALRALFTELEFTSLLKELLPVVAVSETHYTEAKSAADVERVLAAVSVWKHARSCGRAKRRCSRGGKGRSGKRRKRKKKNSGDQLSFWKAIWEEVLMDRWGLWAGL